MYFRISDNTHTNDSDIALFTRAVRLLKLTAEPFTTTPINVTPPASTDELTEAILTATEAGKDPAADKEVQRLLTSKLMHEHSHINNTIQVRESRQHMEHLLAQAPNLLEQITHTFTQCVDTMRAQIPTLGHADLTQALNTSRPDIIEAGAVALQASTTTNRIITETQWIRRALTHDTSRYELLWYCKPTNEQFKEHNIGGHTGLNRYNRPHNIWDLLNDGIEVEITTDPAKYAARVSQATTTPTTADPTQLRAAENTKAWARTWAR